jgi:hypothetical protein
VKGLRSVSDACCQRHRQCAERGDDTRLCVAPCQRAVSVVITVTATQHCLTHVRPQAVSACKVNPQSNIKFVQCSPNKDSLHHLSRHLNTLIFHLRTGHCRPSARLRRNGVKPSALCHCGEADQTLPHFLQSCPLYQRERQQIWPQYTSLDVKL